MTAPKSKRNPEDREKEREGEGGKEGEKQRDKGRETEREKRKKCSNFPTNIRTGRFLRQRLLAVSQNTLSFLLW